jgi:hypothetical protein
MKSPLTKSSYKRQLNSQQVPVVSSDLNFRYCTPEKKYGLGPFRTAYTDCHASGNNATLIFFMGLHADGMRTACGRRNIVKKNVRIMEN